ncbi:OLC1v1030078C1 [Oldenlandia corymbosa var. corymbosa]|uniref:OLC1v1030078C1 n=1 Tax=Oldenlandia corymbosa var. corymbosa TaxID=529605 RepID=A0AAV1CGS4_OLDCO|nr:OLC1v1030078C1 [Oldenlandia corymbosa var. corymbosa]
MGCASSKSFDIAANNKAIEVYRPPPTSFAVFDVNAIEEPWIKAMEAQKQQQLNGNGKPAYMPDPLLEKLNAIEEAPRSWDEVSKALEDLKPTLQNPPLEKPAAKEGGQKKNEKEAQPSPPLGRKSFSFHTLEELEAKLSSAAKKNQPPEVKPEHKKTASMASLSSTKNQTNTTNIKKDTGLPPAPGTPGYKSVKDNIFIVRDRLEREKEGKPAPIVRFNPLSDFPEKCPPNGADSVVIYTTSLGGVRRTFEDCNTVRTILEWHRFVFDERDVSLHGEYLNELKELLGEGAAVPRMFIKGRYIGGAEEVVNLNETGRLGRILNWARVERGTGRLGCEGCGGARFVPCMDCGGSCKVVVGEEKERCRSCNENGLILCPLCD